jgi:predicted secreted Zn-dependent protease
MGRWAFVIAIIGAAARAGATEPDCRGAPAEIPEAAIELRDGVKLEVERNPYTVRGSTAAAIREDMTAKSWVEKPGAFDATVKPSLQWTWHYDPGAPGGCALVSPMVNLKLSYWFPSWDPPEEAPAELKAQWAAYIDALQRHELGHRNVAVSAANAVLRAFQEGFSGPTCKEAEAAASVCIRGILAAHEDLQKRYDAVTNHGATQGAQFGPKGPVRTQWVRPPH